MLLQRKAFYNLIRLNLPRIEAGELPITDLQEWQTANYRNKTTEELLQQLKGLQIDVGSSGFEVFGAHFEAPEEIVEVLAKEREPLEKDQLFLIFFELWRRIFPEKRTISIFCDELDNQIVAYNVGTPHAIADALTHLQQLLDEQVDQGLGAHQAFQLIQIYCANDLESFLFDYILAEIDAGNYSYAKELLDGFKRYVQDPIWFDYLQARSAILEDPEEGYELLERVIEEIHPNMDLDLLEEMLFFLANTGNHSLFYILAKKVLPLLKTEEDFQEFLEACYAHYDYLELKLPSLAIAALFYSRNGCDPENPLLQSDPGIKEIRTILDQKVHFAEE